MVKENIFKMLGVTGAFKALSSDHVAPHIKPNQIVSQTVVTIKEGFNIRTINISFTPPALLKPSLNCYYAFGFRHHTALQTTIRV